MKINFSYILISILVLSIFLSPFSSLIQAQVDPNPPDPRDVCPNISGLQLEIPEGYEKDSNGQCVKKVDPNKATLLNYLRECGVGLLTGGSLIGCFLHISYFILVTVPSFILVITAKMFDYLAGLTLSNQIYELDFIGKIWAIIRDFSNIFFILILLYAAFQIILGLGHGGGKKIVASVILIALLVNFSLFFSKVVIDFSNVLALIFYNKIECIQKGPDGKDISCPNKPTANSSKTNISERNISEALVSTFHINKFFTAQFFQELEDDPTNWRNINRVGTRGLDEGTLSNSLSFALMAVYAMVVYPLAWIFFITGMSFLGRTIMLMLLMIVSPLAFVTASVPQFSNVNTIGFKNWLRKLLETAFVATIFMAILYLVYRIMNADIFTNYSIKNNLDLTQKILIIFIPALLIIVLLKKGSEYAKKASGEFTGMIMSGAKILGGLALGGVALGAAGVATVGRNTVGGVMKRMKESQATRDSHLRNLSWNPATWGKALQAKIANKTIKGGGKGVFQRDAKGNVIKDAQGNPLRREGSNWLRDQMLGGSAKDRANKSDKAHATHMLDEEADKIQKGAKFSDLDTNEQLKAKVAAAEKEVAKFLFGTTDLNSLSSSERKIVKNSVDTNNASTTNFFNQAASHAGKNPNNFKKDGNHLEQAYFSKDTQSIGGKIVGWAGRGAATGSYDVRKIKGGILTAAGLAAAMFGIAPIMGTVFAAHASGGLRMALKKLTNVDHGEGKGDFLKDLKETLSSTLGALKFDVKLDKDGHGKGKTKGGGGGH